MADRFPAQIWVGGQVSHTARLHPEDDQDDVTVLQGLIGALNEDGASHEYGGSRIPEDCSEADLGNYLTDDGAYLNLKNDQAVNGEFPETEQFCMEHGIPFDRWSDHYCEYDAENVYWRPGMNDRVVRYADSNGKEVVDGEAVRQAMEKLNSVRFSCHAPVTEQEHSVISEARQLLHDACPELPPELEVFNLFT